jgi:8-oxo-dGDP phosphatase
MTGGITTISSRIAYENPWTRVREDIIRRADGSDGLYGVVERHDFVVVLPLHDDGSVTLVEQYRYPVRHRMIELPMGMWEDRPDVAPEEVAAGELAEETGLTARSLVRAGEIFLGPGFSTQRGHVYLATGLAQGAPRREVAEQDMATHRVALARLEEMIGAGEVTDAVTMAAFALLRARRML